MGSIERQSLKRTMKSLDVVALAFGTIIGWGWVILLGGWVSSAGVVGAVIAFVIGAVLCIFVGLTYAELTPALPLAGGELVFAYRGLGYTPSWITGWMITFAYIGVAAFEGPSFSTALTNLIPVPKIAYLYTVAGFDIHLGWLLVGVAMAVILTVVNILGIKSATIFQTGATVLLCLGGLTLLFGSVTQGDISNAAPAFTSFKGLAAVLLVVPAMFVGFDVIPQAAEEMNIELKSIAKILIFSICLAALWYILMILSLGFAAPLEVREDALAGTGSPAADALEYVAGRVFSRILITAALIGILTSWNGFIVGASRVLFSMARAKMLPPVFGKLHPKYKTPTAAILLVGVITVFAPFLGRSALVWFIDASAFGTVVAYFMVALSFIALRRNEPDLARPYKVKGGMTIGVLAVLVALFFLYLYLPVGPSPLTPIEWVLVLVWVALGVVFYGMTRKQNRNVTSAEIEYMMFGDEYARKDRIKSGNIA
ncbi:MAG: APC family permease [Clostridiales Family XIII bacterium]|jgi:amino acid transporter|nr:APC family permease [Clostridiales Family XIII bacterium]